jgi:D-glycero-D-manno-heptose 1,7-bisphosphate phosphatase
MNNQVDGRNDVPPKGRPALFLDRDGVINVDRDYVCRIEDFEFIEGIFKLCHAAADRGYVLIVITNQAGIGRGYYTKGDFDRLTEWMLGRFVAEGIKIARVYSCPHHPTAGIGEHLKDCFHRKPNPGMILKAKDDFSLDLAASIIIGDKTSDMEAGRRAGIGTLVLLSPNSHKPPIGSDVMVVPSLMTAGRRLFLSQKRRASSGF